MGPSGIIIPGLNSEKWGKAQGLAKMWDLEMGPEQIYNLIPFSWLGDWFSNLGDVVSNFASSLEDNLVAQYAYVMLHERKRIERTAFFKTSYKSSPTGSPVLTPLTCKSISTLDSKSRVAANPYGFAVGSGDLSPYRTSILSALGISRLNF